MGGKITMKKIILIVVGLIFTTNLYSGGLIVSERTFNDDDSFLSSTLFYDDLSGQISNREQCNLTLGQIQNLQAEAEGSSQALEYQNGGSLRKSSLFGKSTGGTEITTSMKNIILNLHKFKCSLTDTDDIRKLSLALFFRIPKGDWNNPTVRKLSNQEKMKLRKSLYLMQFSEGNFSLSKDFLLEWILLNYENYEGEKIPDADKLVRSIITGNQSEIKQILETSKFLNNALKYMKEGEYYENN
jgi:hypothetical protein